MLRRLSVALLAFSVAISPLPLWAQEGVPSEREIVEFNKNFLNAMDKFLGDKEVSEFLGVLSVVSLAHYNCELIEAGVVRSDAVDELLSQYYLSIYDVANRDMAIHMQSSVLSDYIVFSKDVVRLCDPRRILPRFKGLPISAPE